MTQPAGSLPAAAQARPPRPAPWRIDPPPGSLLDQLMDEREAAVAQAKDATARAEALTLRIKNEVTAATGGYPAVIIGGTTTRPPYQLGLVTRGHFNRKQLAADRPDIHDYYWVPGDPASGHWELRKVS